MARARNNNNIDTPVTTGTTMPDSVGWGLWNAATGGDFLFGGAHTNDPAPLAQYAGWRIEPLMLIVTFAASPTVGISEEGAEKALNGLFSGTVYVSHHSAAPGNTGANEISGNGYGRVALALADVTIGA